MKEKGKWVLSHAKKFYFKHSPEKLLFFITTVAFLLRFSALFFFRDFELQMEWSPIVNNLIEGKGFSYHSFNDAVIPSAYMPPLYAFFLYFFFLILGNSSLTILVIQIFQALFGAFLCLVVYEIAKIKFSKLTGVISSLILAFYPVLVYSAGKISSLNVYLILSYLTLLYLFKSENAGQDRYLFAAGVAFGLAQLSRSEFLLYLPFLIFWIAWVSKKNRIRNMLMFLVLIVLVVGPWYVRNYRVFGKVVPITISFGYNLWRGNNIDASGAGDMNIKIPERVAFLAPVKEYELERDRIFLEEAKKFILENPVKALKLSAAKFIMYWSNVYYGSFASSYPGINHPLVFLPWLLLMPGFIVSFFEKARYIRKYFLLYVYLTCSTIIVMIFFALPRYSIFVLPVVIIFSVDAVVKKARDWLLDSQDKKI
jgi:4-amino-4-deoxy-L-arabinose transferase-like glycosyltransferase